MKTKRTLLTLAFAGSLTAWLWTTGFPADPAAADPATRPPARSAAEVPKAKDVAWRLFLVGDAGVPLAQDAVLATLTREVADDPARAVVVYLGDNVYPRGLPPKEAVGRKQAEARLDLQIAAVAAHGATAIFIPGNHDWNRESAGGWAAVQREAEYVDAKGDGAVSFAPRGGCPGPVVRDFDPMLRLVLLDTQWWLQSGEKPKGASSSCSERSEADVAGSLERAVRDAGGRRVVVAGHHPLATGGVHGGHFEWTDHIFPLRAAKSWLWIPIPAIGSVYSLARRGGVSAQDISGRLNRKMREAISGAFSKAPPLVYCAGHEHSLQVLKGADAKYLLVSGAGAYGHVTQTAWTPATLYAAARSGYMRLDVEKGGRVRLAVITVDSKAKATEAFAVDLTS